MGRQGGGGDSDFSPRGGEALFAPGRGKGTENCFKNPPKQANTKHQKFRFFFKFSKFCSFEANFGNFYLHWGNKIILTKGGLEKNFFCQGGVNGVSGRRGDSDFALQEGGNVTLPPHAHVWRRGVLFPLFQDKNKFRIWNCWVG